jgi:hypothetical protein
MIDESGLDVVRAGAAALAAAMPEAEIALEAKRVTLVADFVDGEKKLTVALTYKAGSRFRWRGSCSICSTKGFSWDNYHSFALGKANDVATLVKRAQEHTEKKADKWRLLSAVVRRAAEQHDEDQAE